jgi:hemerythrin-like domain-containing protein
MATKEAAMSDTMIASQLLAGHDAVARLVLTRPTDTDLLSVLRDDHRAVMAALDRICEADIDFATARSGFLVMKSLLESHSLAEERVLYARLKQNDAAKQSVLRAGADHEMVSRTLEDMSDLGMTQKQWMSLANTLRKLLQEHVAIEESEIFELAKSQFEEKALNEMGSEMHFEKARVFTIVA